MLDVAKIKIKQFKDHRGDFNKVYSRKLFSFIKKKSFIKEVNYCLTKKRGTIRGMHFQFGPFKEDKIVTCLKGEIFDVVIDLRKKSKSFMKYKTFILNEKTNYSLFIPKGFAHGYQSITNNTLVLYLMSANYASKYSSGINPFSKSLNIQWPVKKRIVAIKDKNLPDLTPNFKGL
jgi:dTDP-4-dehydrorhamnose 3,5-epimerase